MNGIPYRRSALALAGQPVYAVLAAFPAAAFTLALLTDLAYWRSANVMWQNFSAWLLFAGLVFGALAALARLLDFALHPAIRALGLAWAHALIGAAVLCLAIVNSLVHAGDGWTAVVPTGLALSVATVVLMLAAAWAGRRLTLSAFQMGNVYG